MVNKINATYTVRILVWARRPFLIRTGRDGGKVELFHSRRLLVAEEIELCLLDFVNPDSQ